MFILECGEPAVVFVQGHQRLRVAFVNAFIARITFIEGSTFKESQSFIITAAANFPNYRVTESLHSFLVVTDVLQIQVSKDTGAIQFLDGAGRRLLQEPRREGKTLKPKEVYRNIYAKGAGSAMRSGIDGARAEGVLSDRVLDRHAFEARLEFEFSDNEALFGLGSHEEGHGNLRGKSRQLYQQNMKAVVPYFVSTKGYGVLVDCSSLMTFHDDAQGSYIWADVVDELDYYFIAGGTADAVTRGYYFLTGKPPLLPKWSFGYVQSKERYVNAEEIFEVVREYRRREIPLDVVVLDWKSWPNGNGWGQKSLDPARFPDPQSFINELHGLGAKLMVSVWPIMTGGCENQKELLDQGLMLGDQSTYDAFQEPARRMYWDQANRGLFSNGVDAWWCDCTEPFEADWNGAIKPDPIERLKINTSRSKRYLDEGLINAYSLMHSRGIYEGQRQATDRKRVVNLTRSSYAGQHRYSTITWSGDVSATWDTLRRSIPEGFNFCATGEPYWTLDIGGFFIKTDPSLWFWSGDYEKGCRGLTDMEAMDPDSGDTGCTDLGYWELYTRWLQYGAFLPMFRSHGTDAPREIWRFGEVGGLFYDIISKYIKLRYRLIPYIYSVAARISSDGMALVRAVALEFPEDTMTHNLLDQYFFGPSLMVCPVTAPMYYGRNSTPITGGDKTRSVYLPKSRAWYDFWTESPYDGGQQVTVNAPLETLPLFVPAGSIIILGAVMPYVNAVADSPYEVRVYGGADAVFLLYEDEGDTYNYEKGAYSLVRFSWDEDLAKLTISERLGSFIGLIRQRTLQIVAIFSNGKKRVDINYKGEEVSVSFAKTTDRGEPTVFTSGIDQP